MGREVGGRLTREGTLLTTPLAPPSTEENKSVLLIDLPKPGIKSRSPALQADSLPAELPGEALLIDIVTNLHGSLRRMTPLGQSIHPGT